MQTTPTTPSVNRFLIDQDGDDNSVGSVPIVTPFRIGRREGFDLCLASPNVSGLHAEILEEDGKLWLYDLNSTNGTFVNDERVDIKSLLKDSDTVVFGNRTFRVILADAETSTGRHPMATVPNPVATDSTETPKEKFQRLLDSGAVPFFQPIYKISSEPKRLIGYEVLGRSRIFGLNTPGQMFAAALPLEMESDLSRVLRQRGIAAAQNKLPDDLKLFVNTHPAELECSVLGKSLHELRKSYPDRPIVLELSEASLNSPETFSELRSMLRNLDIGLALHDFSAGKIHLAELNEIAPDIVKFDSALIHQVNKASLKQQRLIRAMVKMVKELGITPMAEYIESADEHKTLTQMGFDYAQGFHYGHPIDITTETAETIKRKSEPISAVVSTSQIEIDKSKSNKRPADLMKELEKEEETSSEEASKLAASRAGESRASSGVPRESDWLIQQRENYYTIQLMMSPSKESAEDFIAKQSLAGEYALYHKEGKSSIWFVVLHGVFENREIAKPRAEEFKRCGISPLIRRLSAVQNEIRKRMKEESKNFG